MHNQTLQTRQDTTRLLRSDATIFRWHPLLIDVAIDLPYTPPSVTSLIHDPAFQEGCREQMERYTAVREEFDGNFDRLLSPDTDTLSPFYFSVLRRTAKGLFGLGSNRHLRSELLECVRFHHLKLTSTYQPGIVHPDGSETFWGFKAYFEKRIPFLAHVEYRRRRHVEAATRSLDDTEVYRPEPSGAIPLIDPLSLASAVRCAITTALEADLFWRFVAEGAGLFECAAAHRCSSAKVHARLKTVFIRIARHLGAPQDTSPDVHACRQALASMVEPSLLHGWLSPLLESSKFPLPSRYRRRNRER